MSLVRFGTNRSITIDREKEVVVDVAKLTKELADLQYDSGYRFENGVPFCERLSAEAIRAVLSALRERGYTVVQDVPPEVESPALHDPEHRRHEPAR